MIRLVHNICNAFYTVAHKSTKSWNSSWAVYLCAQSLHPLNWFLQINVKRKLSKAGESNSYKRKITRSYNCRPCECGPGMDQRQEGTQFRNRLTRAHEVLPNQYGLCSCPSGDLQLCKYTAQPLLIACLSVL